MSLTGLLHSLRNDTIMARIREAATADHPPAELNIVAPDGARPAAIAAIASHKPVLVIASADRAAEDIATELTAYLDPHQIAVFPSWETLPHERLSPRSDTVGRRIAVLRRLTHPDPHSVSAGPIQVLVAPVRSVIQPLVKGLGDLQPVRLVVGQEIDPQDVAAALTGAAYSRVDMVEKRGEFAVRGGIIDVFGPDGDHPVRVEFFGDTVEELRHFSIGDQRSLPTTTDVLWAPPVREILLTDEVRARAEALKPHLPSALDMLDKISAGIAVDGMESLTPALVDGMELLIDLLPPQMVVLALDPEMIAGRADDLVATSAEFLDAAWANAAAGADAPVDLNEASFWPVDAVMEHAAAAGRPWWNLAPFGVDDPTSDEAPEVVNGRLAHLKPAPRYQGRINDAMTDVTRWCAAQHAVVVTCAGKGSAQRVVEQFHEAGIPATLTDVTTAPTPGVVSVTTAQAQSGVLAEHVHVVFLTESDLLGRSSVASAKDGRRMPSKRRNQVDPLALQPGDHVVHEQHGVGRFVEMIQRTIGGATREYLVLEYAASRRGQPADRLFVPSDTLDQVSRYVGGESPSVNKLGGADWSKTKSRARKAVKEIAGELIRLYSARMATSGHAFGPDTPWQAELEEAFPYMETPDQMSTIDEVKTDMEKTLPMDRLICGDVGYGKTEIAVRAAFKAIQDGKQVAVLCPTTLLVQQHVETFTERFANFPVTVKSLSRFQSAKVSEATIEGLRDGSVDLVIGTHRLLSKSVKFKDLGLVIVDEEQRFGVEHKETLKAMRTNVDVLAMSATPIPRTLEMAVTGIREMSTLATPPEERHPVLTYVGAYEEKTVTAAIRRELLREGQVFYIHNRTESIEKAAARIRELVPDARVETAHGKMGEKRLEEVIVGFWEKRFDVLVCTTIVETGLDIANANTIILERADLMGLSQLHQLRGRVGRSRDRAYAYFLYPPEKPLTENSHDRLKTIAQNTDLGAGMQVAMKDLEIRGAGNLLGGEQSGHIAGVGFDLYVRLVGEAVQEFKGEVPEDLGEVKVELPINAHLPHSYVSHERLRLEAYRKLSAASTFEQVDDVVAELTDRYGQADEPVQNLFGIARLRVLARQAGISEIMVQGNKVKFAPVTLAESQQLKLRRLYPGSLVKAATSSLLVPKPTTANIGGQPLRDQAVLDWAMHLLRSVGLVEGEKS